MNAIIKRHWLFATAVISVLVAPIAWKAGYTRFVVLRAQVAPATAYTLHRTEVVRSGDKADGPARVAAHVVIAQRSDGARCELYIKLPGEKHEHRLRTIQLADMRQIRTWDHLGLKATSKEVPPQDAAMLRTLRADPSSECTVTFGGRPARPATYRKAERTKIQGIEAIRFVVGATGNASGENWYAPRLGCEEVYFKRVFTDESGNVTDSSEKMATSFSLGEPDPGLFDVSGLRETSILEAEETHFRRLGYTEEFIQKQLAGLRERSKRP
jgi:hypothetical protein